jgi:hypothetical protein
MSEQIPIQWPEATLDSTEPPPGFAILAVAIFINSLATLVMAGGIVVLAVRS